MRGRFRHARIEELVGKTLSCVTKDGEGSLYFVTNDGKKYEMTHLQCCCETVSIEDVCGDLEDLVGSPILQAEETSNGNETNWGHETWTFYKLATKKGYVTIRWHGTSNGYYSEAVDFVIKEEE